MDNEEKWDDEDERQVAYENMFASASPGDSEFLRAVAKDSSGAYCRWVVNRMVCSYGLNFASTPMQAVRNAVELGVEGWAWHVYDKVSQTSYRIESNSYIYQPLENMVKERIDAMSIEELDAIIREKIKAKKEKEEDHEAASLDDLGERL